MQRFAKGIKTFISCGILLVILSFIMFLYGCNYGGMVNFTEQVAIYQNIGFVKAEPTGEMVEINNLQISINTKEQINEWLNNHKINAKVTKLIVLALPSDNKEDKLDALLYLYFFDSNSHAKNFYNSLKELQSNLQVINNAVLQKGYSPYIDSSAVNHYYFINFYKGIKK